VAAAQRLSSCARPTESCAADFKSMSSRAVEMLKEDMEVLGPVRSREVAQARRRSHLRAPRGRGQGRSQVETATRCCLNVARTVRHAASSKYPPQSRRLYGAGPSKGPDRNGSKQKQTKSKASQCQHQYAAQAKMRENILPELSNFLLPPGRSRGIPVWSRDPMPGVRHCPARVKEGRFAADGISREDASAAASIV